MKKTAFIVGVLFFLSTTFTYAQTETTQQVPPVTTHTDQWNNNNPDKYKMLPMPEPLTKEKMFPVIGHYNVASKDGVASDVTIKLDESNKGIVWVAGLPVGEIKAYLKKVPGTYMIPAQKSADQKDITQGVLIFDKSNNTLDVCIGCTYNNDDPASVFTSSDPVVDVPVAAKSKKGTAKAKIIPVKTWKYSGSKIEESTASIVPMQQ
jgi:hypothetical protein